MSGPLSLYRLQQIDSRMEQIRARLETIRRTLEDDAELHEINTGLAEAEAAHLSADRALRQIEAKVEGQRTKIEQAETSLYSGNVHNPKELQDLQNDVAALKRHLATLEDRQLEAMLASESAEAVHQEALAALQSVQKRLANQHRDLTDEQTALNKELERLAVERLAVVNALAAETLNLYEQLRQQRRGVAVAEVTDNACSACGAVLTPAQQQVARSVSQIAHCPTCGRILYAS